MTTAFDALVQSRQAWIRDVLVPWCETASRTDLLMAEQEWVDIAGNVAPRKTLWAWAWGRFPALVCEGLGLDESRYVEVTLVTGVVVNGFPNERLSTAGQLVLTAAGPGGELIQHGPFPLEEILSVSVISASDIR